MYLGSWLRCGKWPVAGSQPAGPAGQLLLGTRTAHHVPRPQPAQGVLPLPLRQRLRLITKDHVPELFSPKRTVSRNSADIVFYSN
ncbi:hypothetical protein llap_20826 [Limosa lapponica baueri]|uniref:Uncharacterized protein n=1 Tax=Limosa lapponica baueri TaxID=1758121 RepID=A0A2I0T503_LIMLA|nr:hypothetical protein llap_20826 [Limosa lapponica baueri]